MEETLFLGSIIGPISSDTTRKNELLVVQASLTSDDQLLGYFLTGFNKIL